jgi:hypothetical protein
LCTEFGDLLDDAESEEAAGNYYGAASVAEHLSSRVEAEQAEFVSNGYWLFSLNVEQARSNLIESAEASADQWHFVDTSDGPLTNGRALDSIAPTQNYVSGSIDTRSEETFHWLEPVTDSLAFEDGLWAVQLHFFDVTDNKGPLTLEDVSVARYTNGGTLLESKYIQSGAVASVGVGETRVSLSANLTGWSAGNDDDYFVVTFTLANDNKGNSSESYKIATGTDNSSWGASWVSKPN